MLVVQTRVLGHSWSSLWYFPVNPSTTVNTYMKTRSHLFSSKDNLNVTKTLQNTLLEMATDIGIKLKFKNTESLVLCYVKIKYKWELTEIALKCFLTSRQYTSVRLSSLELRFLKEN